MLKRNCQALCILLLLLALPVSSEEQGSMISKPQLQEMFDSIAKGTDWDLSKELLWGYFFSDNEKDVLIDAAQKLAVAGYRLVDVYLADKESPEEGDLWWLHIEKVEVHTVDSLHNRNTEFYSFAQANQIGSYDGMDVGPAPPRQ